MINYLLIISVVKKPHQYTLLIDVWLLAIAHSCFHAFMQGGKIWGSQWLKDENQISAMLVTAIPFAFFMLISNESKLKKCFYAGCLTSFTAVIILSFSRGGFVALLTVAFFCWLATERKLLSIIIISAATVCILYMAPPDFFDEMETIKEGTEESTAGARIYQWRLATQMFIDHPIVGIGPLNYPHKFSEYDQVNENKYFIGRKLVLHSTPFTFLSETGLFGTAMIIFLQILLFHNWRITTSFDQNIGNRKDTRIFIALGHASAISLIGFWVASIFLHLVPFPFYWILVPFSESVKRLKIQYVLNIEKEDHNSLES
jgi:O-antigen ligase